jgi:hypothetical protein
MKHRTHDGTLQGQLRQHFTSSLPSPPLHHILFLFFFFGNERCLDLKVSGQLSSILGMLTLMWRPNKRSLLSLCKHNHDFVPCFMKNPKDIAASWLKFLLLPGTISTWNQSTAAVPLPPRPQTLSCSFLPLKIIRLKCSPI